MEAPELDRVVRVAVEAALREREPASWKTLAEAAAHCRIGRSTLRRHIKSGTGPKVSGSGRHIRVHLSELDSWMRAR